MREDRGPGLVVAQAGFIVGESGMGETEKSASVRWSELDGDHGFGTLCGSGEPGHFDEAVALKAEKAAVVGMALSLKMRLEKEGRVDFGPHHDRAWRRKPAIELFGPRQVERGGRCENGALTD